MAVGEIHGGKEDRQVSSAAATADHGGGGGSGSRRIALQGTAARDAVESDVCWPTCQLRSVASGAALRAPGDVSRRRQRGRTASAGAPAR